MSTQDSTKTTQSSAFTSIGVTSSRGSFTFLGLLAFSFAELGFANLPNQSSKRRLVDAPVAVAGLGVYVLHACHLALLQSWFRQILFELWSKLNSRFWEALCLPTRFFGRNWSWCQWCIVSNLWLFQGAQISRVQGASSLITWLSREHVLDTPLFLLMSNCPFQNPFERSWKPKFWMGKPGKTRENLPCSPRKKVTQVMCLEDHPSASWPWLVSPLGLSSRWCAWSNPSFATLSSLISSLNSLWLMPGPMLQMSVECGAWCESFGFSVAESPISWDLPSFFWNQKWSKLCYDVCVERDCHVPLVSISSGNFEKIFEGNHR